MSDVPSVDSVFFGFVRFCIWFLLFGLFGRSSCLFVTEYFHFAAESWHDQRAIRNCSARGSDVFGLGGFLAILLVIVRSLFGLCGLFASPD